MCLLWPFFDVAFFSACGMHKTVLVTTPRYATLLNILVCPSPLCWGEYATVFLSFAHVYRFPHYSRPPLSARFPNFSQSTVNSPITRGPSVPLVLLRLSTTPVLFSPLKFGNSLERKFGSTFQRGRPKRKKKKKKQIEQDTKQTFVV